MNSSENDTQKIPPNSVGELPFTPLHAPNAVFVAIFAILLAIHLGLTFKFWRYYGYTIGMLCGLLLELLGYVAKVQLSYNHKDKNGYIMYIIGLTLGPTFLSAALYLGISNLQRYLRTAKLNGIGPKAFSGIFITGDFICLCFIGCGGSLAAIFAESPIGVDLMIAGLAIQVFFTCVFCIALFAIYRRISFYITGDKLMLYMGGAATSAACLFVRSTWRVAELSDGFNGPLASKERVFIALDSVPMMLMSGLLTALHPAFWFRSTKVIR